MLVGAISGVAFYTTRHGGFEVVLNVLKYGSTCKPIFESSVILYPEAAQLIKNGTPAGIRAFEPSPWTGSWGGVAMSAVAGASIGALVFGGLKMSGHQKKDVPTEDDTVIYTISDELAELGEFAREALQQASETVPYAEIVLRNMKDNKYLFKLYENCLKESESSGIPAPEIMQVSIEFLIHNWYLIFNTRYTNGGGHMGVYLDSIGCPQCSMYPVLYFMKSIAELLP